ncbi:MAG: PIN domain-containing protein [Candidatus Njordarchaeales archaeon]
MLKNSSRSRIIVLDANIWIKGLFGISKEARQIIKDCLNRKLRIVVNSYIVAEVVRVLKRIAMRSKLNPLKLERNFWIIINSESVIKDFITPVSEDLIEFLKNKDEILLISKIFNLEPKDVPYIVLAFKFKAPIITEDKRSIYIKRREIEERIGIRILTLKEFKAYNKKMRPCLKSVSWPS